MTFRPELAALVMAGAKTQTRRLTRGRRCSYKVGKTYAVQPGRGKHAIGRLRVTDVRFQRVGEISDSDARREGFSSADEFVAYWRGLHGEWWPDTPVHVISFEVCS